MNQFLSNDDPSDTFSGDSDLQGSPTLDLIDQIINEGYGVSEDENTRIQELIELGADPLDSYNDTQITPLELTTERYGYEVLWSIVNQNPDFINPETGQTILMEAIERQYPPYYLIKHYIDRSSDLNYQDSDGNTALHLALFNYERDVLIDLLQAGARMNIPNHQGLTVEDLASTDSYVELWEDIHQTLILPEFIQNSQVLENERKLLQNKNHKKDFLSLIERMVDQKGSSIYFFPEQQIVIKIEPSRRENTQEVFNHPLHETIVGLYGLNNLSRIGESLNDKSSTNDKHSVDNRGSTNNKVSLKSRGSFLPQTQSFATVLGGGLFFHEPEEYGYVVYQLIPGVNFHDWLIDNYFSQNPNVGIRFENILLSIFTALEEAYRLIDFTHYDLHYGNIIIRPDGSPVIIDYGYSHFQLDDIDYGYINSDIDVYNVSNWRSDPLRLLPLIKSLISEFTMKIHLESLLADQPSKVTHSEKNKDNMYDRYSGYIEKWNPGVLKTYVPIMDKLILAVKTEISYASFLDKMKQIFDHRV